MTKSSTDTNGISQELADGIAAWKKRIPPEGARVRALTKSGVKEGSFSDTAGCQPVVTCDDGRRFRMLGAPEEWDVVAVVVHCDCGKWSGESCGWTGPGEETVVVEFVPEQHRASHTAAGNRGVYPHNGAVRVRVERSCAQRMVECDGDWCEIVEV